MKKFEDYEERSIAGVGCGLTPEEAFELGLAEARDRLEAGEYPRYMFTKEEVNVWRTDIAKAAADIARRALKHEPGWEWLFEGIERLGDKTEPRYSVQHFYPVSFPEDAVAVDVWFEKTPEQKPVKAYYGDKFGFRSKHIDQDGYPLYVVSMKPMFWRYSEPKHVAKNVAILNQSE